MAASENDTKTRAGAGAGGAPAGAVLGIGAPAADTGSLVRVLTGLPPDAGLAVVLALQHREALDEAGFRRALGARAGALAAVAHGAPVEAGRIYLPAPSLVVAVEGGRFKTRPAERGPGGRAVIDGLFVSLARDGDGHAIGLVIAGTGADGTLGLAAIKDAGGFTLAEGTDAGAADLADSGGPAALADLLLPAEEIPGRVALHARHIAQRQNAASFEAQAARVSGALDRVAAVLRERTGHDFHGYKRPTFLRRVQRRMQVVDAERVEDYVEALRSKPDEAQQLFNDLLIGVTRFFRDRREFEFLEREVVPRLFEGKTRGDRVRVWVLGCSTGEEAYSVAILLREHAAKLDAPPGVQVFATDLDGRALAVARAGRYKRDIREDVLPERLARWFVEEGDTYVVTRELRDACVFSQHSLVKDTPFSRLDLISCRNLLIYLGPELQDRVIPLFHFALKPDGYLFLGASEGISGHTMLFAPVDRGFRVFRKLGTGTHFLPDFPAAAARDPEGPPPRPRSAERGIVRHAERLAERHAPAYAVVDEGFHVLHFSPRAGRFIHPSGAASLNLLDLVHDDLRLDLRGALNKAAQEGHPVRADGLEMDLDGRRVAVDLVVEPVQDAPNAPRGFVVLFKDGATLPGAGASGPSPGALAGASDERVRCLEAELRVTRERLQAAIEELESTNEELKASNEEYQSLNEELQSANEELATSKEELQSVNEELTTVNHELAHRVQELDRANSDLKNLLASTQIATVFLDNQLRVTNFTPAASEVFHLVESDLGRPLLHVKPRVAYDALQDDARRVLRTLGAVEREVEDPDTGARYMVRVLPYRNADNVVAGAVVTFTDITPLARAQAALRESEERLRYVARATRDVVWDIDLAADRVWWNDAMGRQFGYAPEEIGPDTAWYFARVHPDDRGRVVDGMRRAIEGTGRFWSEEFRFMRADGAYAHVADRGFILRDDRGEAVRMIGAMRDVTEPRRAEERLRASEARLRLVTERIPQFVWTAVDRGKWTWSSGQWSEYTGQAEADSHGLGWLDAVHPDDRAAALAAWRDAEAAGWLDAEYRVRSADGAHRWFHTRAAPLAHVADAQGVEWFGTSTDVHGMREMRDRQGVLVAELQHRTRNLIAVVRSLAEKTMEGSGSLDEFRAAFRDRLAALSRVQGLLSRLAEGERATFDQLIRAELTALGAIDADGRGPQAVLDGPQGVRLRSSTVQTFALALHELATNALKYGALSRPEGRLLVRWRVEGADGVGKLRVEWKESGVAVPDLGDGATRHWGYGRELIEHALPYQLQAETSYKIGPDGVRCTIAVPVSAG